MECAVAPDDSDDTSSHASRSDTCADDEDEKGGPEKYTHSPHPCENCLSIIMIWEEKGADLEENTSGTMLRWLQQCIYCVVSVLSFWLISIAKKRKN